MHFISHPCLVRMTAIVLFHPRELDLFDQHLKQHGAHHGRSGSSSPSSLSDRTGNSPARPSSQSSDTPVNPLPASIRPLSITPPLEHYSSPFESPRSTSTNREEFSISRPTSESRLNPVRHILLEWITARQVGDVYNVAILGMCTCA